MALQISHRRWGKTTPRTHSQIASVLLGIPWPALRGPFQNHFWKKRRPQPYWGGDNSGNALEAANALNYRVWGPQPYSRGEFQETLWERFRGLSGIFPGFLPESPSRTGGMAHSQNLNDHRTRIVALQPTHRPPSFKKLQSSVSSYVFMSSDSPYEGSRRSLSLYPQLG